MGKQRFEVLLNASHCFFKPWYRYSSCPGEFEAARGAIIDNLAVAAALLTLTKVAHVWRSAAAANDCAVNGRRRKSVYRHRSSVHRRRDPESGSLTKFKSCLSDSVASSASDILDGSEILSFEKVLLLLKHASLVNRRLLDLLLNLGTRVKLLCF